ncbi:negative regulation of sporulation, septation and degradative enzyme [Gracilibacillus boraciitolerans JCM 21714]|uniref:Negative regulation of sporulation, septation and degradative enzyme n=1 Tax=Gracilibacillus boraciitolerans JCM 21714 TaxID=1298598 RepID=W4VQU3_9BACI|nr:negative regulation of sporulation, septation and degradative enzyme [Gracilibacillus boraciitolerans JCM 21714]
MKIKIRKCTLADSLLLQEISCEIFSQTFKHQNSVENMSAYLEKAFNLKQLEKELATLSSQFFLFILTMKSLVI